MTFDSRHLTPSSNQASTGEAAGTTSSDIVLSRAIASASQPVPSSARELEDSAGVSGLGSGNKHIMTLDNAASSELPHQGKEKDERKATDQFSSDASTPRIRGISMRQIDWSGLEVLKNDAKRARQLERQIREGTFYHWCLLCLVTNNFAANSRRGGDLFSFISDVESRYAQRRLDNSNQRFRGGDSKDLISLISDIETSNIKRNLAQESRNIHTRLNSASSMAAKSANPAGEEDVMEFIAKTEDSYARAKVQRELLELHNASSLMDAERMDMMYIPHKGKGKEVDRGTSSKKATRFTDPFSQIPENASLDTVAEDGIDPMRRHSTSLSNRTDYSSHIKAQRTRAATRSITFFDDPSDPCAALDDEFLEPCPEIPIRRSVAEILEEPFETSDVAAGRPRTSTFSSSRTNSTKDTTGSHRRIRDGSILEPSPPPDIRNSIAGIFGEDYKTSDIAAGRKRSSTVASDWSRKANWGSIPHDTIQESQEPRDQAVPRVQSCLSGRHPANTLCDSDNCKQLEGIDGSQSTDEEGDTTPHRHSDAFMSSANSSDGETLECARLRSLRDVSDEVGKDEYNANHTVGQSNWSAVEVSKDHQHRSPVKLKSLREVSDDLTAKGKRVSRDKEDLDRSPESKLVSTSIPFMSRVYTAWNINT